MRYKVNIEFTEQLLGTIPKNEEVYKTWVELKQAKPDEEPPEFSEEKSWTGFHSDGAGLYLFDYQIKGFLKEAASILPEVLGLKKKSGDLLSGATVKGRIDSWLFVFPRRIYFSKSKPDGYIERPLRARTMQGERITLVRSDYLDIGTGLEFEVYTLFGSPIKEEALKIWLQYGELKGIGQWRNSSYGRFKVLDFKAMVL